MTTSDNQHRSNNRIERKTITMRSKFLTVVAGAAVAAASVGLLSSTANAAAPGTPPVAAITVTPPTGTSSTSFTALPPSPSFCPGDAVAGYRINSFVVPIAVDPATLTYNGAGPVSNGTDNIYPLYDTLGTGFINATPGLSDGLITGVPAFSWSVFVGTLPAGNYHIGLACTLNGVTATYFSTDITLTAALGYSPLAPPSDVPEVPLNVLLPISAAAILGGGFLIARKRHNHIPA
ncbi:MAG TPA: hypothetical protein VHN36_18730 [Ilumatobacteraceae bacterium]|nr:hypothetical protein [Ilumatobacteraceae bacterium]